MCGLVGCVGNITSFDRKAFKQLLILDTLRGDDGTGIGYVTKEKMLNGVVKAAGSPYYLFGQKSVVPFINQQTFDIDTPVRVLLGHNRAATVGKLTDANSHPFHHEHIIGAHNGTLKSHLLYKLDSHNKFEVDSEAVIYNISKFGKEAIKNVAGAYALTWWDDKDKHLYFIRNKERPLYFTRSKDKDTFWWASESWMLEVVLSRNHIQHDEIKPFDIDHLYKIYVGMDGIEKEFKKVDLEKVEKLEGFTQPTWGAGYYQGGYGMWDEDYTGNYAESKKPAIPLKNSNITNFPTSKEVKLKNLKRLYNQTISFYIDGTRVGPNSISYLYGSPTDPTEDYEIRVYNNNQPIFEEMKTSIATNDVYKARVRKAVFYQNDPPYILMDHRTILKVMENQKLEIRGHDGAFLTPEEFYQATSKGCCWCSTDCEIHDASEIKWLDKNDFLCVECKDNPEVQNYLPQLITG